MEKVEVLKILIKAIINIVIVVFIATGGSNDIENK